MDSFLVFALELVPGTKGVKAGLEDTHARSFSSRPPLLPLLSVLLLSFTAQ